MRDNSFSIISPCSAGVVIFRKSATLVPTGLLHVWMKNSYGPNFLKMRSDRCLKSGH